MRPTPATRPLADQAFLSDCRTSALVDREGVIAWYCPLGFDRPSVFGAILDDEAGSWRLGPPEQADARAGRAYEGDSLVLRTNWDLGEAAFAVTDFLALEPGAEPHELGRRSPGVLVRIIEGVRGRASIETELDVRFEYGLTAPRAEPTDGGVVFASGPLAVRVDADVPLDVEESCVRASFEVGAGERVAFALSAWNPLEAAPPARPDGVVLLNATRAAWRRWSEAHAGYDGHARDAVRRSALMLQGLTDGRTGAVLAAATTSLPELIGGTANWDYRFAWLRDLAFTMRALWVAACPDEADAFLRFIAGTLGRLDDRPVPILVGSDGRRVVAEQPLIHLSGWRDSRPVRVGNRAWIQRQLDVLGEVLDSGRLLSEQVAGFDEPVRDLLVAFADRAARDWHHDDAGMWEARDRERPYTSSKVMCWVALDRAIDLATAGTLPDAGIEAWREAREAIRGTVLREAWSDRAGAFAGALGSDELDASVLLMPLVGFVDPRDPRWLATLDAVRDRLTTGPLVHRWADDQNGFLLCSYWLVECEALAGRQAEARRRFEALSAFANDVGILTEMVVPATGEAIGNLPQAFSHVGLINAAWRLTETTPD